MQLSLPKRDEITTGFGGLRQVYSAYNALSWLISTADSDTLHADGIAFMLELINERFAHCLALLEAPDTAEVQNDL